MITFFFFGCTRGLRKFPGQELNWSHSIDIAKSLTTRPSGNSQLEMFLYSYQHCLLGNPGFFYNKCLKPLPASTYQPVPRHYIFLNVILSSKIVLNFAKAAITKSETGWLKQQELIFSVLETGSPTSKYQQGYFRLKPLSVAGQWLPSCCVLLEPFFCTCAGARA